MRGKGIKLNNQNLTVYRSTVITLMNTKLMNITKGICNYIFDAVMENENWYDWYWDERYRDCTRFHQDYEGWVDGVHFYTGGFAEGAATSPEEHVIHWIDLDFLEIWDVKEGALTPEEVEELKRLFNPERTSFDLRDVIPERFQ